MTRSENEKLPAPQARETAQPAAAAARPNRTQLGLGPAPATDQLAASGSSSAPSLDTVDGSLLNSPLETGILVERPGDLDTDELATVSGTSASLASDRLDGSLLNQPLETGILVERPTERDSGESSNSPLLPAAAKHHVPAAEPARVTEHKTLESKTVEVREDGRPHWQNVPTQPSLKRVEARSPEEAGAMPAVQARRLPAPLLAVVAALLAGVLVVAIVALGRSGSSAPTNDRPPAPVATTGSRIAARSPGESQPVTPRAAVSSSTATAAPASSEPAPPLPKTSPQPRASSPILAPSVKSPKPKSTASPPSTSKTSEPRPEPPRPEVPFR